MPADRIEERRIDQFFSGAGARADDWRGLVDAAKAWVEGLGDRATISNRMAVQALLSPGDIIIVERNCHKSHHYGMVLPGAAGALR